MAWEVELPTNGGIEDKDVCQQRLTFFIFFLLEVKLESFGKSESRGAHKRWHQLMRPQWSLCRISCGTKLDSRHIETARKQPHDLA